MDNVHELTQDNGGYNNFEKISVSISDSALGYELRRYFKWRKDVGINRLMKEGSTNYDKFIKFLSRKGY